MTQTLAQHSNLEHDIHKKNVESEILESATSKEATLRQRSSSVSDKSVSDEENRENPMDCSEENYHVVLGANVLGVHKKERPKATYLFVITVRWSDDRHVTIYRNWKEIKEFQNELLRVSKNNQDTAESRRYLKKTARSARSVSRFKQGTMQKLNMIDGLNQFFEAVLHFKTFAQSISTKRFFKPNDTDLTSMSWSGDGRTYFYMTRDILGKRNDGFDDAHNGENLFGDPDKMDYNDAFCPLIAGTDKKNAEILVESSMKQSCEPNQNIYWPNKSNIHIVICDFVASDEDKNVINLQAGEEICVLDRSELGWWLVSRTSDRSYLADETRECGYVPASYLKAKEFDPPMMVRERSHTIHDMTDCATKSADHQRRHLSYPMTTSQIFAESCFADELKPSQRFAKDYYQKNSDAVDQRGYKVELRLEDENRNQSKYSDSNTDESLSSSTFSSAFASLESLASITDAPDTSPAYRTLAFPDSSWAASEPARPPSSEHSTRSCATPLDPEAVMQSQRENESICDVLRCEALSPAEFTSKQSIYFSSSPVINRNSTFICDARRGVDYISTQDYDAMNQDELSFKEGAIISVNRKNSNGWWLASYQGKTGVVPAVHIRRYKDPFRKFSLHVLDML